MGRNNRFISITVFSKSLEAEIKIETEFRLIAQPYWFLCEESQYIFVTNIQDFRLKV